MCSRCESFNLHQLVVETEEMPLIEHWQELHMKTAPWKACFSQDDHSATSQIIYLRAAPIVYVIAKAGLPCDAVGNNKLDAAHLCRESKAENRSQQPLLHTFRTCQPISGVRKKA